MSRYEYDRSKLRANAGAGVKECWLVLVIEVHRKLAGEQFAERSVLGPGGSVASAAVPSFTVDLGRLFVPCPGNLIPALGTEEQIIG